jgi:hypothetical protein
MFDRAELYQWRCVRTVVEVVDQMPGRWFARGPMILDETSVGVLLLWTWLRFESDFLTRCLEQLGVDLDELTEQVDAMLNERKVSEEAALTGPHSPRDPAAERTMHDLTIAWLGRAADEAGAMHQGYVGIEHFLLAFLHNPASPIAALLSQFRIDYERLRSAIHNTIRGRQVAKEAAIDALIVATRPQVPPWQAISGRPAVGLPKRFSMAVLMSWVTLFAVVFSVMQAIHTPPEIFGLVTVLMFCVGIGQMWLFGGTNPRGASIVTGAVVLPIEVFLLNVTAGYFFFRPPSSVGERIAESIPAAIVSIPLGAFFGYLAGGITAGIVLGLNYLEKRKAERMQAETLAEDETPEVADESASVQPSAADVTPPSPAD